jgi:hypothetical protein
MTFGANHIKATGDIHIGLTAAVPPRAIPSFPPEGDDPVDRFDSWYVEKHGTADDDFYEFEGQGYVRQNVRVVTAQVENASVRSASEFDVAYGMKAEINTEVQVSQRSLGCLLRCAYHLQTQPSVTFLLRQQTFCWVKVPSKANFRGILVLSSVPPKSPPKASKLMAYILAHHTKYFDEKEPLPRS